MDYSINGIPVMYDYINAYNSRISPSTIHINSGIKWYFMKQLLQEIIGLYDFELPEDWNHDYFKYVLFVNGFISVLNTDIAGVICQHCTLSGRDIYYAPKYALITNPAFDKTYRLQIGVRCGLIKLRPDYTGIMDIVDYYSDMLALAAETAGLNLQNTKLAYVFLCADKQQAESFKKLYDQIAAGNPAAFADKKLFNDDGTPNWVMFNQQLRNTYIAGDILEDMRKWKNQFCTEVGIPNANTDKKERLIRDEVNANSTETQTKAILWLETIRKGMEETNDLFGLDLSVKLHFNEKEGGSDVRSDALIPRTV